MSRGIGGGAEILTENETEIVYKYYNYNLNIPEHRNAEKIMDGRIIMNRYNQEKVFPDKVSYNN